MIKDNVHEQTDEEDKLPPRLKIGFMDVTDGSTNEQPPVSRKKVYCHSVKERCSGCADIRTIAADVSAATEALHKLGKCPSEVLCLLLTKSKPIFQKIKDGSRVESVLRNFVGDKPSSAFISDTLPLDLNLSMTESAPACTLVQAFVIGKGLPPILLTVYDGTYNEIHKFTATMSKQLTSSLLDFCHCYFDIVPCSLASCDLSAEKVWVIVKERQERSRPYCDRDNILTGKSYAEMRAAAIAVSGVSYVPCFLQDPAPKEAWLLLLDADWRRALSLFVEKLADDDLCHVTYTPESEFKVKVAVTEAAKRWSFVKEVTVFTREDDTTKMLERLRAQIDKDVAVQLRLSVHELDYTLEKNEPQKSTMSSDCRAVGQLPKPHAMEHAVDDPPTDHRPSALTSVLVAGIRDTNMFQNYMESRTASGGGPVQRVYRLGYFTHGVDFHNHADAVNVARREHHSIEGRPVCVFLYDTDRKTVYSGHQTESWQDGGRKQVVHIPRLDPRAPTTVIATDIPYVWGATADSIKVCMENLGNVGCRVKSVQCVKPVCIAIVEFERSEDAKRVGDMGKVTVPSKYGENPVLVFVLRPLPSDPDDIPNKAHTAIAGMPVAASAARVGQTQDLERNQAPGAPVTPPRYSRTMQAGITSGTSRAEGTFQKEKSRVQDQMEEQSRVKDQLEETIRENDQMKAYMKAHVEDTAKTQLEAHQRQCQEAHQRQIQEQNEYERLITSSLAAANQNSLVRQMAVELVTMRGQYHALNQQIQAMQDGGDRVAEVKGPGLEVTNPSEAGSTSGRPSDED